MTTDGRLVSVVIPVYNEEENLRPIHWKIRGACESLGMAYEQIFVDDGSTDKSFAILAAIGEGDDKVKVVRLSRNFGQTAALAAGISYASGDVIVTLDSDLQNDPADISRLISKLDEGYDLVNGWRVNRHDRLLTRRLPSVVANRLIGSVTRVRLHDYGCTLKAFRANMARALPLYGEMHRFVPALVASMGGTVTEIPVNHCARVHGTSNYGISRTIRVILDLITVKFLSSYSTRPIHVFGSLGLLFSVVGGSLLGWLAIERLVLAIPLGDRPILLLGVLLMVVGVQFITMGLLGEMTARTYHETQGKPVYVVKSVLDAAGGPRTAYTRQKATERASWLKKRHRGFFTLQDGNER